MATQFNKSILCPVLVGRADLMTSLTDHLNQAWDGQGGVILLSGEAGLGKSRLVAASVALARQQGLAVQQASCFESDRNLPYAPLLDLLRAQLAADNVSALKPFAGEFVKLLPELNGLLPQAVATPALDPEPEKRRHFQNFAQFLTRSTIPGLIIVEDLHWADDTTLEFLAFLARAIAQRPIALLLTFRSAEAEAQPSLRHLLADLDRTHQALELALVPLTLVEVETMLRAIFEQVTPVRAEFVDAIYALTEGNPFFIEEILKALVALGDIFYTNGEWNRKPMQELRLPRSIADAVQRRTEQLSQTARQVLALAAVAGRRFDFDLLLYLTQLDEAELLEQIKQLIAAQLVVEESSQQFAFRHALSRQAVYGALLARERLNLHRSIAQSLEHISIDRDQLAARAGDLAYHFSEAGLWEKALLYSRQAGLQAQTVYAPRAAIEHFTRALQAAAHISTATPKASPIELYRGRGLAYELVGDFDHAHADQEIVLAGARDLGDQKLEWQALLDLGNLWASRDYEQAGDSLRSALTLARQMNDPAILAHSLNRLGNWYVNVEQPQEGLRYHQEALRVFEELHDERGRAETFDLAGMACYLGCDCYRGTTYYEQAVELFRKLGDRAGLSSSLATLTMRAATYQTNLTACPVVDLDTLAQEQAEALKTAQEMGWRSGEAYANLMPSFSLGSKGQYAAALNMAQAGLTIAQEIDHLQWVTAALCAQGAIYLDLLALKSARACLEPTLAQAQEMGSLHWTRTVAGFLTSTYIQLKDLDHARALLGDALRPNPTLAVTLGDRLMWCARAELALAEDDPATALQIVDLLAPPSDTDPVVLRLEWLRGQAYAALKEFSGASAALDSALKVAMLQGALPLQWRIFTAMGQVYLAQGNSAEAEELFAEAASIVERLAGQLPDPALAAQFRQQAFKLIPGQRAATAKRAAKQTSDGLTTRERQIAILIAQGQSNKAIAQTLVVSDRTVEGHVSNILGKLGLASRAQIAAWAVEKGLTTSATPD